MIRHRQSHRGFSLTEVLMAAAILGVGMTMVASVFPVAVDQSRMSRDTTMAALSARSIAAVLRARRGRVLVELRRAQDESDPRDTTWMLDDQALPEELRCYNPSRFLYPAQEGGIGTPAQRVRTYQETDLWSAGSYVPVVFATPMNTLIGQGSEESEGPWRITIAIYKSRGQSPASQLNYAGSATEDVPLIPWDEPLGIGQGEPGDFFMDFEPNSQKNFRGEAYKVSRIFGGRLETDPRDDSIFPVAALEDPEDDDSNAFVADRDVSTGRNGDVHGWLSLRGAIAVYHTILGE
ncbi:MAG: prepilin-type N-terminal cleavage/methylation domain-containing protein [Phycisphaerae bacterium]